MVSEKFIVEISKMLYSPTEIPANLLRQMAINSCRQEFNLIKEMKEEMDTQLKICLRKVLRNSKSLTLDTFLELANAVSERHRASEVMLSRFESMDQSDISIKSVRALIVFEEELVSLKKSMSKYISRIEEELDVSDKMDLTSNIHY